MAEALAYFDTSVLIKRYVEEPGSDHARRLMRRYRLLSSVITSVETYLRFLVDIGPEN